MFRPYKTRCCMCNRMNQGHPSKWLEHGNCAIHPRIRQVFCICLGHHRNFHRLRRSFGCKCLCQLCRRTSVPPSHLHKYIEKSPEFRCRQHVIGHAKQSFGKVRGVAGAPLMDLALASSHNCVMEDACSLHYYPQYIPKYPNNLYHFA